MTILRNILAGVYYMTVCRCCGEPFGARCDYWCSEGDCFH